ncbi:MAG: hypothetical protein J0I87_02400, partial [Cellulomonas sp.]|nr:hypothetical protein [Cellulomonas sp.]
MSTPTLSTTTHRGPKAPAQSSCHTRAERLSPLGHDQDVGVGVGEPVGPVLGTALAVSLGVGVGVLPDAALAAW